MGIDRHEWEHRNYKSGRDKAAPVLQVEEDPNLLVTDSGLGADEAPQPPAKADAKVETKTKSKAASKPASKPQAASKDVSKSKPASAGKRSGR